MALAYREHLNCFGAERVATVTPQAQISLPETTNKHARSVTDTSGEHHVTPEVIYGCWYTSCVNLRTPQAFDFLQCGCTYSCP